MNAVNLELPAPPLIEPEVNVRPERVIYPENPRYQRIRFLSVLMDQSIALPNGYRIGLDPLLGLLPGIGDILGGLISCYLVYQSARLGVRKRVLVRMLGNIALDTVVGTLPIAGDIFDAAWKSNMRNLRLLERHYHLGMPERSAPRIIAWFAALFVLALIVAGMCCYLLAKLILGVIAAIAALLGF
jgi:hypothetical protein